MKQQFIKIGSLLVMAATVMLVGFTSCGDKEPTLKITPTTAQAIAAAGSTFNLVIESENTNWEVSCPQEWVEFSETTGSGNKTIEVTVKENETEESRTATVTVTSSEDADLKHTLTINQAGKEAPLTPPADAGAIAGDTSGEDSVVLTAPAIERAQTYEWAKDGETITGATANTYTVTESGTYKVRGVNPAGAGGWSPDHTVEIIVLPLPADAGEILGDAEGEGSVVLTAPAIENARTYEWAKDGETITGATANTYTATQSGAYKVRGVNATGAGGWSPEKSVTIIPVDTSFIDALVGEWQADGYYIEMVNQQPQVGIDDHSIIINRIDETTIEIIGVSGVAAYGLYGPMDMEKDYATATVKSVSRTITIPFQAHYRDSDQWPMYLTRFKNNPVADNWEVGFDDIPVSADMTIDLGNGGFNWGAIGGVDSYASFVHLGRDPSNPDSKIYFYSCWFCDTVWYKVDANNRPYYLKERKAPVAVDINIEAMQEFMKNF